MFYLSFLYASKFFIRKVIMYVYEIWVTDFGCIKVFILKILENRVFRELMKNLTYKYS